MWLSGRDPASDDERRFNFQIGSPKWTLFELVFSLRPLIYARPSIMFTQLAPSAADLLEA